MTHHTEAERADFEALARKRGWVTTPHGIGYDHWATQQAWVAWQAARRAPAAPVPQGDAYSLIDRFLRNNLDDADYAEYSEALDAIAAAPQPPEVEQSNSAEFDGIKTKAAPVQMPEPAAEAIYVHGEMVAVFVDDVAPDAGTKLYTEQQVRQLLAAHGIKGE